MAKIERKELLKIKPGLLLSIYSAIPLALILVLVDQVLFEGGLRNSLIKNPDDYPLFALVFTLPHIISSYFGFFDREYLKVYGKRLLRGSQIVIIGSTVVAAINLTAAFYILALFTMYHVFKQQSGIARSLIGKVDKPYQIWEWMGVLLSFAIYVSIFSNIQLPNGFMVGALLVFSLIGLSIARQKMSLLAQVYLLGTILLPTAGYCLVATGYPILALAVPRIIHDVTAYFYYASHDHNRYLQSKNNYIYNLTSRLGLPVIAANIVLSMTLAFLINRYSGSMALLILMVISLIHYYFESFIWKRDSVHRRYIILAR